MSKKKVAKKHHSTKSIWSVAGLEKRCQELIRSGALSHKSWMEEIATAINNEFEEKLGVIGRRLSQHALKSHLRELVWTKKIQGELWSAHSNGMMEKFRQYHSYIPSLMIDRELRALKGVTHSRSAAEFKAGMGRLSADDLPRDAGNYEFPHITFAEPYVVSEEAEGQMLIINGALVGIKYPAIEANTLRRALAHARKCRAKAVVLTNLMDIWTKKTAGYLAVYRAVVSGIHINPDRFPADYQQEVQDILDGTITDKVIYQTLNERFEEIADGLHKITHRKKNQGPEFPGPVLIQLCLKEEELIAAAAYYEMRYMSIVEQNKLEAELNMASNRLEEAKNAGNIAGMNHWSAEVARLGARKARALFTNHTAVEYEFYRRRFRAYVVKRLEETIPNSTVISQGSTWLKVDDGIKADGHIIKTVIPHDDKVSDGRLTDAGDSYGADVHRSALADLTIVCPAHSLNHRYVGRDDSKDGQGITKFIHVAPSCLDGEFLREAFKDISKLAHPVQELVFNPQFKPGVLCVSWMNGILSADSLPIERLARFPENSNFAFPNPGTKYLYWYLNSDSHFGAPDKRYIWDPAQRIHRGVNEAGIEMMRRSDIVNPTDMPVHATAEMDDATNGDMWFKPRYHPDPEEISILQYQSWLHDITSEIQLAAEKGDQQTVLRLTSEVNRFSLAQLYFRGEDFPAHQIQMVLDHHINPNVDFYNAVLRRFDRCKLVIRGISKINKVFSDTRDLAVHNFPNGNHLIKTAEQVILEGDYPATHLQEKLAQEDFWKRKLKKDPEFLRERIRAPRYGNETFGWGTIKTPDGFEWGIRILGSPPRLSSWSDLLAAMVRSDLARGDDTYGLMKYITVTFIGDKHFYCKAETARIIYLICAAGVRTSLYGSSGGFPPNNTGVMFVGLPVDGPEAGPIITRMITHDFLRDWFTNPKPFDWAKFLPNPL